MSARRLARRLRIKIARVLLTALKQAGDLLYCLSRVALLQNARHASSNENFSRKLRALRRVSVVLIEQFALVLKSFFFFSRRHLMQCFE